MAKLTEPVQRRIVELLACYERPTAVAEAIQEEFGVTVDRRHVQLYDAERSGRKPATKWIALFTKTRAAFQREVNRIPIANKAVRIRELQRILERAMDQKNPIVAMEAIERAAKEMGDAYTNRRILTPEDPAEALSRALGVPVEQLRALADDLPTSDAHGDAE